MSKELVRSSDDRALSLSVTSLPGLVALAASNLLSADGTLAGAPIVQSPSAGARVILIDGAGIGAADDGLIIDNGGHASVEFSGTPPGTGPFINAFQANLALLRVVRYITWARAYADAAGYITLPIGSPA